MPRQVPKNINSLTYKGQTPVNDYLKAKLFRDERLWQVIGERCVTFINGGYLDAREFEKLFPIPLPVYSVKDNPDQTKNYLR